MRTHIAITLVLSTLALSACDSEEDRLRDQTEQQRRQIEQLSSQNKSLLESQAKALNELRAERDRQACVQSENSQGRNHHELEGVLLVLTSCALAVTVFKLARRRNQDART